MERHQRGGTLVSNNQIIESTVRLLHHRLLDFSPAAVLGLEFNYFELLEYTDKEFHAMMVGKDCTFMSYYI